MSSQWQATAVGVEIKKVMELQERSCITLLVPQKYICAPVTRLLNHIAEQRTTVSIYGDTGSAEASVVRAPAPSQGPFDNESPRNACSPAPRTSFRAAVIFVESSKPHSSAEATPYRHGLEAGSWQTHLLKLDDSTHFTRGEMAEWLKARASKACIP
ncbi:MAG: hypothetical protein QOD84_22 [Acidobacteriaceae bacterium]|jgi:hypothetical protein